MIIRVLQNSQILLSGLQGWKVPDRSLVDTLLFRPSCLEEGEEADPTAANSLEAARTRLLELEAAIERRYGTVTAS